MAEKNIEELKAEQSGKIQENYDSLTSFDRRIQRRISVATDSGGSGYKAMSGLVMPYHAGVKGNGLSYAEDYYASKGDVEMHAMEALEAFPLYDSEGNKISENEKIREKIISDARGQIKLINDMNNLIGDKNEETVNTSFHGFPSMMHPYAIMTIPGAIDGGRNYAIDTAGTRKWYETDNGNSTTNEGIDLNVAANASAIKGRNVSHYAKIPTTTAIINWGNQDPYCRFPYAFQDFVYCKYWNRIPNNRMITLRRYPNPTVDTAMPATYDDDGNHIVKPNSPLATAVTYFGEGTDNTLSSILSFTVGYNWEEIKKDIWQIGSQQNDDGQVFGPGSLSYLGGGLAFITHALGIMGELQENAGKPDETTPGFDENLAKGLPPDPYSSGMYENRIIGPVNTINNVMRRTRGLKFSNDGLSITFEYVARPIANVNSKAIMLDLLANILVMTSASGTWFGGIQRYREDHPALFTFGQKDIYNKIYNGKILGPDGAFTTIVKKAASSGQNFWGNFLSDFMNSMKDAASSLVKSVASLVPWGDENKGKSSEDRKAESKANLSNAGESAGAAGQAAREMTPAVRKTLNSVLTTKLMKGATIPYVRDMHALLTGEPVGDWHLTIGNPLNPIAMIGNLIMEDCKITMSDELGPDDFPIGFKAVINLKHGMGRDRDAVASMFNKGHGRIYTLPDKYKSSADYETTVDNYTGRNDIFGQDESATYNPFAAATVEQGSDFIYGAEVGKGLKNSGIDQRYVRHAYVLDLHKVNIMDDSSNALDNNFRLMPWTMRYTL